MSVPKIIPSFRPAVLLLAITCLTAFVTSLATAQNAVSPILVSFETGENGSILSYDLSNTDPAYTGTRLTVNSYLPSGYYGNPNTSGLPYSNGSAGLANFISYESTRTGLVNGITAPVTTSFANDYNYDDGWKMESWSGWSISQKTNVTDGSFLNQLSAITGSGANSSTYGVAYVNSDGSEGASIYFNVDGGVDLTGFYLTNTTYSALTMKNGSAFSSVFQPGDTFKLTITGYGTDAEGLQFVKAQTDYYLAGFGKDNNAEESQWRILDEWDWVDLSNMDGITELGFSVTSSDTGDWGINNPTYFAMDQLTYYLAGETPLDPYIPPVIIDPTDPGHSGVPEPSTLLLLLTGCMGLYLYRRV